MPDEKVVTCSGIMQDSHLGHGEKVLVNIAQPSSRGLRQAKYVLPDLKLLVNTGFTAGQVCTDLQLLQRSKAEIMQYARSRK